MAKPIKKRMWVVWYAGCSIGEPYTNRFEAQMAFVHKFNNARNGAKVIMAEGVMVEINRAEKTLAVGKP